MREIPDSLVGGERKAVQVEGFDVGASPREFLEPRAETLILSTTNGTRAILETAERCEEVVLGSLLNLDAVAAAVGGARRGDRVRGISGCVRARRRLLRGADRAARARSERTDAAIGSELIARAFPTALEAFNARTYGPPGLEEDIAFCARENVLDVVPRLAGMVGPAAEIRDS